MIKFMRITNLVLMLLLGLSTSFTFSKTQYSNSAEAVGALIGVFLILSFYFVPWLALSSHSTLRRLRFARRYGFISLVIALLFVVVFVASGQQLDIAMVLGLGLIYGLPLMLNFFAFDKKIQDIKLKVEQAAVNAGSMATASSHDVDVTSMAQDIRQKTNYMLAHWRGNMSLARSYWINGVLLGNIVVGIVAIGVISVLEKSGITLRALASAIIFCFFVACLIWLWSMVGIARSASKHKSRGGSGLLAILAQLSVVLSMVAMVTKAVDSHLPKMQELFLIASGNDSMPKVTITGSAQGDMLALRGTLGEGSSTSFAEFIKASPQVKTIILNSPGGRLLEAQKIADLLKARGLNTYVEEQCASACTYIFLAGQDRAATPNASIGFHQPSFPGIHGNEKELATQAMLNRYRQANLPEKFVQRIGRTSSEDMWYPSREELLDAGVITRTSLGGEAGSTLFSDMPTRDDLLQALRDNRMWRIYEQRHPGKMEELSNQIWKMKLQGADQQALQTALQLPLKNAYISALKSAPDAYVAEYGILLLDQLKAARDVSPDACAKFIKGQLNIHRTLPRSIIIRDRALMEKVLSATEHGTSYAMNSPEFAKAASKLMNFMSPLHQRVTQDLSAFNKQPELQCEASIALYQNIQRLREKDRHVVLSGLVQAK